MPNYMTYPQALELFDKIDDAKQDKLTAGSGIVINSENVISATGGGGGAQYLNDLEDVDTNGAEINSLLQFNGTDWGPSDPGGAGHTMAPDPAIASEENVVTAFNAAESDNEEVPSIYGIQRFSNQKTFRVMYTGAVGHTGIGEWKDYLDNPTASDEASWGWWHHELFTYIDNSDPMHTVANGYDVDLKFKFDPGSGEPVTLGGYIVDTTTGYMCIKFANYVVDPSKAKIAVDITFTRNDISVM